MTDTFLFNRNLWVAVIPSDLTNNRYVKDVPPTIHVHQTQQQSVIKALRGGGHFLLALSSAMGDGWERPSPYFTGADETGVWAADTIPIGDEFGDTHVARVGSRYLALFLESAVNEYHEIIGVITPKGFILPE
jgi:hypothetical protein